MEKDFDSQEQKEFEDIYNQEIDIWCRGQDAYAWEDGKRSRWYEYARKRDQESGRPFMDGKKHGKISTPDFLNAAINLRAADDVAVSYFHAKHFCSAFGPAPDPIYLFKSADAYFYVTPCNVDIEYQWNDVDSKEEHPYVDQYNPPITKVAPSTESETLRYGLPLGVLQFGDRLDVLDPKELQDTPFLVYLHPGDKSLWIVFNCYPDLSEYEGCLLPTREITADPVWRVLDTKHRGMVLRIDSTQLQSIISLHSHPSPPRDLRQGTRSLETRCKVLNANMPDWELYPEVIIPYDDKIWQSHAARPKPFPPSKKELKEYLQGFATRDRMLTPEE